ncbi:MAG: ATP-dependent Clp protease ATP-binding subunit [Caldilineales bacterium]|nr:ATP-dependent Clp protease ATP-binding subunit [Caldilineales bacterium]
MDTLNPKLLAPDLAQALNDAARSLSAYDRRVLTPELLLLAFLRGQGLPARALLAQMARERGFSLAELERSVEGMVQAREGRSADFHFVAADGRAIPLSDEMLVVLDEGRAIAQSVDEIYIGTVHALGAMSQRGVSTAAVLQRYGVTPTALTNKLVDQALGRRLTTVDLAAQARQGELAPVYFREPLLRELLNLLALRTHRHVVLVGPAGVGRRSLVHGLAMLMAEGKGPADLSKVVQVGETALLDDPAKAVQAALRQAQGGVLFLPDIHRFFGSLGRADLLRAGRDVQKALLGDGVVVIGTCGEADFTERLAGDPAIVGRVHRLTVPPPDEAETAAILAVHRPRLEADYGVRVAEGSLRTAASLARRYLTDAVLPASALLLLHRAAAMVRLGQQSHQAFRPPVAADATVDEEDVTLAASLLTGVPVQKLSRDERTRYAAMVEHLHARIIGQEEAVLAVSRAVKAARAGLKDPKRPIGSFLFLGPTGVGKTELARALAEFLFGDEAAMVALDMTEYQQDHTVNRLIGAPPGYVGYEGGGQLTEAVRKRPYTVVLFDEVEKAHPRVLDVLLQIMEEGRLTDGQGRTVSFSETVVILTSNLGAEFLETTELTDAVRDLVMARVRQFFRPEFLNRLDEIVVFHPLTAAQLAQILRLMLRKEGKLLEARGLRLEVSEAAQQWLLARNDRPEWGARPLRRLIQRYLREPLADYLLAQDPPPNALVRVDVGADGLRFDIA